MCLDGQVDDDDDIDDFEGVANVDGPVDEDSCITSRHTPHVS